MCCLFPVSWKMQNCCLWTCFWNPPPPPPLPLARPLKMYAINTFLMVNKFHCWPQMFTFQQFLMSAFWGYSMFTQLFQCTKNNSNNCYLYFREVPLKTRLYKPIQFWKPMEMPRLSGTTTHQDLWVELLFVQKQKNITAYTIMDVSFL